MPISSKTKYSVYKKFIERTYQLKLAGMEINITQSRTNRVCLIDGLNEKKI